MLVLPKRLLPLHTDSILEINRVTSRLRDYTGHTQHKSRDAK